jgi:hypothetical protein
LGNEFHPRALTRIRQARSQWLLVGAALWLAACLGACATSSLERSSAEPGATPQSFAFSKVLVIAMARDDSVRRSAERALDRVLSEGPRGRAGTLVAVPSYEVLTATDLGDIRATKPKLKAAGFDGVVLLAYSSTEHWVNAQPAGFWYDYGYSGGSMMYDPGAASIQSILRVHVRIYSLREDRLLWSGTSRSEAPSRIEDLVVDVAAAVAKDLERRGLRP